MYIKKRKKRGVRYVQVKGVKGENRKTNQEK